MVRPGKWRPPSLIYWEPVTSELLFIIILFFRFSNRPFPPFIFQIHLSLPPLSAIRKISKEILHVTWIPHETLMSSLHKQIKKSISRAIIDLIEDREHKTRLSDLKVLLPKTLLKQI